MASRAPSRSTMLSPISFHPPTLMDPHVAGGTTRRSRRPDWVLLHKSARISGHRNTTTAGCHTTEGQAIEVSFWLVDPPGVSYFSVHCPGLNSKDFADEPHILCAEAALLLFSVTFVPVPRRRSSSTQHFVYRAGPGKPSLHLIPDSDRIRRGELFGLFPFGDATGHYAVVCLNKQFIACTNAWRFHVYAFSSVTRSWSSKVPSSAGLSSEDDQKLLLKHATCKQIMVGASSLGWVDLFRGILLLHDVFGECPVIEYVSLPASRVRHMNELGHPYIAPEYCCDVSCCDGLIKFVEVEFDDPGRRTRLQRQSRLESHHMGQDELELKKLIFYTPTLSKHDDNLLDVVCMVNSVDDDAWVIAVDMEHAAVEAIAPYSTRGRLDVSWHCPCTFPKYLDLSPEDDVTMHSNERISDADFVLQSMNNR
ncbi:unnamed protein product [Alopecurus aequalis]